MSLLRGRGPSCLALLALLLLALPAAAQSDLLVRPLVVDGVVRVLLTRVDLAGGVVASSMPPSAQDAGGPPGGCLPLPETPQQFRSAWLDGWGLAHLFVTEEEPDETADAHAVRHAAGVATLLVDFPPAGGLQAATPLEPGAQALETSWKGMTGLDHSVVTVRKTGESLEKWAERHADGVAALLKLFPPKPTGVLACAAPARERVA